MNHFFFKQKILLKIIEKTFARQEQCSKWREDGPPSRLGLKIVTMQAWLNYGQLCLPPVECALRQKFASYEALS